MEEKLINNIAKLSTDLKKIILKQREEMYFQDKLDECNHYFNLYSKLYTYYFTLYYDYDLMIDSYFFSLINYTLDYKQLHNLYIKLGGRENVYKIQYCKVKNSIKKILNYEFLISAEKLIKYINYSNSRKRKIVNIVNLENFVNILILELKSVIEIEESIKEYKLYKIKYIKTMMNYILLKLTSYRFRLSYFFRKQIIPLTVYNTIIENKASILNFIR